MVDRYKLVKNVLELKEQVNEILETEDYDLLEKSVTSTLDEALDSYIYYLKEVGAI
jgi:hypothetical protein